MALRQNLTSWLKKFYREGRRFRQFSEELAVTATCSPQQLAGYQNRLLQSMISHCYKNVPYYQDLFRELKLKPEDIQTRADLVKLPLMDKHTVRQNFDKLVTPSFTKPFYQKAYTSGSTGTPGRFLRDYDSINFENAAVWRYWHRVGNLSKRVVLRGELLCPVDQSTPPFWKHDAVNQDLIMSSYHLSLENGRDYIDQIFQFQPEVLYCYPSSGAMLARIFKEMKVSYPFKAVFTSSESLEAETRALIEETFQTNVYDWYGQAERVAAICQCDQGVYHIQEDYSIVELLVTETQIPEALPQIVGTHLHNKAMPLLRYMTHDYLEQQGMDGQCGCGSHFRAVGPILGRASGYLITPDGRHVSNAPAFIMRDIPGVLEAQFQQEIPGQVTLKIVTNQSFTLEARENLAKKTKLHTSPDMAVTINEVPSIPRGPNGKFIGLINKVEAHAFSANNNLS